ncbi:MAG: NAD(P)H nitroreductase [Bacteroidales bacterium]|nr:NAD(P)H nitroreductase [Bacteroidales bacterium]
MKSFLDLLKNRRSCRRFTNEPLDKNVVADIIRAALMSPSGHRINPWEFILVEDRDMLKALSVSKAAGAQLIEGAAMAVVVAADTTKTDVWIEDASIATIIMQLAVEDAGLGSCWVQIRLRKDAMENSAEENVKELLALPEHYAVLSIVAIGHKERESRPFDEEKLQWEKVHIGKYGTNED